MRHYENESESKICIPTIFNHVRTCFYYNDKYEVTLDSDGVADGGGRREGKGDVTKAECDRESLFSRIGELFPRCLLFRLLSSLDFREKNKSHTSSHLISSHLDSSKY